ncbi:MAG: MFS transporter [Tannerellaceae bacterium]|nr:MFS transporter [Tannerellaceae bacterium]
MENENVKLREKIGYGLGDAASSMFWKLFTMYLLFFYTDVVGLSAAVVGTMFLITRIWDTFLDPIIGVVGDRTESRWGKFRPYLLWIAIPFGICGILTFTTVGNTETTKIAYAYVTYTLMMMIYSLINVPYASLLGVMSANPQTRTEFSSYRMTFAFGGSMLVLALVEPLTDFFSKMKPVEGISSIQFGWQMAAIVFAVMASAMFLLTFLWTKERVRPITEEKGSLKNDLKDLGVNKPWWILLGASVMVLVFNSLRDGSAIFFFKYYVTDAGMWSFSIMDASLTLITIYLVLGQAFNIVGIMCVPALTSRLGKKMTFLYAMAGATVLSILFYFLPKDFITGILLMQTLISFCAGIVSPLMWSMYADITDYSEWKTGRRATGLIFSSSSMSQKLGWTIGGSLSGWLLFYFGFQANTIQTESALNGICLMMSIFPACATLLSVFFISRYPLNEKKMKEISTDLETRRKESL